MSATRSAQERASDVRRLLDAMRELVRSLGAGDGRRQAPLVEALVDATGLSPENVLVGLDRHLETDASDDDLRALVASAGDASRVTVILSANVFVGALRAVALARAASREVVVRPSRREPVFARALVEAAARAGERGLVIDEGLSVRDVQRGEIHVYGRDATIHDVRRDAGPSVIVRGHGSGMGAAWITRAADLAAGARALAADVVVFDQQGCLSPRLALVEGGPEAAARFATLLHEALAAQAMSVPRGRVPDEVRAAAERWIGTLAYAGEVHVASSHAVGVAPPGAPLLLPPTHRHVQVTCAADVDAARAALAALWRGIVAVGSDDPAAASRAAPSWARVSALGAMQRPPLDGPVDRREG